VLLEPVERREEEGGAEPAADSGCGVDEAMVVSGYYTMLVLRDGVAKGRDAGGYWTNSSLQRSDRATWIGLVEATAISKADGTGVPQIRDGAIISGCQSAV